MLASAAAVSVAATEVAVWLVCVIPVAVMNVTVTELAVWLVMVTSVAVVSVAATEVAVCVVWVTPVAVMDVWVIELWVWLVMVMSVAVVSAAVTEVAVWVVSVPAVAVVAVWVRHGHEIHNLGCVHLESAHLKFYNLRSANLRSANLRHANLRSMYFRFTNLGRQLPFPQAAVLTMRRALFHCRRLQTLRDNRLSRSTPAIDLTGVDGSTTPFIASHLRKVVADASLRVVTKAVGPETEVAWKDRRPAKDDAESRPWHLPSHPHSRALGRLTTVVTLRRLDDGRTYAVCNGWNCQRFLSPCSCLAHVYPGPLHKEDLHPSLLLSHVAGAAGQTGGPEANAGMLVGENRLDRFGCPPAMRLESSVDILAAAQGQGAEAGDTELGAVDPAMFGDDGDDDCDDGLGVANEEDTEETGSSSKAAAAAGTVSCGQLNEACAAAIRAAGDRADLKQRLLELVNDATATIRDLAVDVDAGGNLQEADLLFGSSSNCHKLGQGK